MGILFQFMRKQGICNPVTMSRGRTRAFPGHTHPSHKGCLSHLVIMGIAVLTFTLFSPHLEYTIWSISFVTSSAVMSSRPINNSGDSLAFVIEGHNSISRTFLEKLNGGYLPLNTENSPHPEMTDVAVERFAENDSRVFMTWFHTISLRTTRAYLMQCLCMKYMWHVCPWDQLISLVPDVCM